MTMMMTMMLMKMMQMDGGSDDGGDDDGDDDCDDDDGDCKHEFYCSPSSLSYIRLYKWVLRSADKENVNDGDHFRTHPRGGDVRNPSLVPAKVLGV